MFCRTNTRSTFRYTLLFDYWTSKFGNWTFPVIVYYCNWIPTEFILIYICRTLQLPKMLFRFTIFWLVEPNLGNLSPRKVLKMLKAPAVKVIHINIFIRVCSGWDSPGCTIIILFPSRLQLEKYQWSFVQENLGDSWTVSDTSKRVENMWTGSMYFNNWRWHTASVL